MKLEKRIAKLQKDFVKANGRYPDRLILGEDAYREFREHFLYGRFGGCTAVDGMLVVPTSANIPRGMEVR